MSFAEEKKAALKKMKEGDKSNIGKVDEPIRELVDKINQKPNYYTTSSCAGRIVLIKIPDSGKKLGSEFVFRTHNKVKVSNVKKALQGYADKKAIWFRMQSPILYVACKTIQDADRFLRLCRPLGFKRSGLFELSNKYVMEVLATESMDAIVAKNKEILVSDVYLKVLVDEANRKLKTVRIKINKLNSEL